MDVKTILQPGDKGTRSLLRKYGQKLVAVPYRYNMASKKRYKTVELIEEQCDWNPVLNYLPNRKIPVKIGYTETALREKAKAHGGHWDSKRKMWLLEYQFVLQLKLKNRMIVD